MTMRYAHLSPDHLMAAVCGQVGECIPRESGEIGRRTRLRIWRGNPWGFESPLSHQFTSLLHIHSPEA